MVFVVGNIEEPCSGYNLTILFMSYSNFLRYTWMKIQSDVGTVLILLEISGLDVKRAKPISEMSCSSLS